MTKVIETTVNGTQRHVLIRKSTNGDLDRILNWLQEEETACVDGNFLCNRELTRQSHKEGQLLVLLDEETFEHMGYQWGALLSPGILQIRNIYRRNGLGRILVKYCMSKALENNETILFIQCEPPSSIPFWEKMGFKLVSRPLDSAYAYQILAKKLTVPTDGEPSIVRISSYPEKKNWQPDTSALAEYSVNSVVTSDGTIHLAERISLFSRYNADVHDLVVGIMHGEETVYLNKAKYAEAKAIGIQRCRNGYFVEKVMRLSVPKNA